MAATLTASTPHLEPVVDVTKALFRPRHYTRHAAAAIEAEVQQQQAAEKLQRERALEARRQQRIAYNIAVHPPRQTPTRRRQEVVAEEVITQQREEKESENEQRTHQQKQQKRTARIAQSQPPRLRSKRGQHSDTAVVKPKRQRRERGSRAQQRHEKEREEEREQEQEGTSHGNGERKQQSRQHRQPQNPSRRVSSRSAVSDCASASSVAAHRHLGDFRRARVLIVGAGPAALAAACQLADEGYYDVAMIEARDRVGGRVHTIDLQQLVEQRRRTAQQAADADSEARLQRLSQCSQLGVVDEGAAFVHGYNRRNRVTHYIKPQHTHPKSEHREQWRDSNGQPVDAEKVNEARRIYSYIDYTVLQTLTDRAGHHRSANREQKGEAATEHAEGHDHNSGERAEVEWEDFSLGRCFDEALAELWDRKRVKWQTDVDGEEEDERWIREQEQFVAARAARMEANYGKSKGKRKREEPQQLLTVEGGREEDAPCAAGVDAAVAGSAVASSSVAPVPAVSSTSPPSSPAPSPPPPLPSSSPPAPLSRWTIADRECDMALKKRILAAVRVSQHCYVAEDSQISAHDLLQCANEPPLSHPEVIPLHGYRELIDELLNKLQRWRRDFCPLFNTRVVAIEEKTAYGTPHGGAALTEDAQQHGHSSGDNTKQQTGQSRRRKKKGLLDNSGESDSAYVEVTVLTKGQDGMDRQETLVADYCIVTVPLGVLKHPTQPVKFSPPLSAVFPFSTHAVSRQDCIDGLAMGCENKVILCWAQQWWKQYITPTAPASDAESEDDQRSVQYFRSTAHPYIKVLILPNMRTSQHTLVMHFAPPEAYTIGDMVDADATAEAMRILRNMFQPNAADSGAPPPLPEPDLAYVSRWHADPYCYGSYSYVPVGGSNHCSTLLAERSTHSRLLFAGEHCAGRDLQTVHGALASGEMAAKQVRLMVQANGKEAEHRAIRQTVPNKTSSELHAHPHSATVAVEEKEAAATGMMLAGRDTDHASSHTDHNDERPLSQWREEAEKADETGLQRAVHGSDEQPKSESAVVADGAPSTLSETSATEASSGSADDMEASPRVHEEAKLSQRDNGAVNTATVAHCTDSPSNDELPYSAPLTLATIPASSTPVGAADGTRNRWLRDMDGDAQMEEEKLPPASPSSSLFPNTTGSGGNRQQRQVRSSRRARPPVVGGRSQSKWSPAYPQLPLQQQQSVSA